MQSNWQFILDSLKEVKEEKLEPNSHVLLIDGLNTFFRNFAIINQLNPKGDHTGGLTGFLRSVAYIIRLVKPTKVIVIFDGQGSSTNKRYLYPDYKTNRNTGQILNWNFDNKEEESEAMASQLIRVVEYLKLLPIHLLSINKIEADDVIGYLCGKFDKKITIMSGDRDFFQLINNRIEVYYPPKKKFYKEKEVFEEFGVLPKNFILYKTFLGDKGDNVPKIKGFGDDKLFKLIPELKEETKLTLEESLNLMRDESKWKEKISNFKNQLEINYKLMDLSNPNIPEGDIETIDHVISNSNNQFDRVTFSKMYEEDLLGDSIPKLDLWLENNFRYLTAF